MDWSKTKTIFIITFLILDFFLAYQFIQKRNSSQLDVILETTIEEQLDANGITYVELPKEITKASYLSGKSKVFTREETEKLKNQKVTINNQPPSLYASFINPIPLLNPKDQYLISDFLKRNIISGEDYTFWKFDEKKKTVICFQKYNGKVIYNDSSMLVLHLNEKNEVVSYEQTQLDDLEKYQEKQEILPAIKAIETLYKKNYLTPGDHVTNVELGYYALVRFTASQVLTPTWHIVVNGKKDYYINAFEGQIINDDNKVLE